MSGLEDFFRHPATLLAIGGGLFKVADAAWDKFVRKEDRAITDQAQFRADTLAEVSRLRDDLRAAEGREDVWRRRYYKLLFVAASSATFEEFRKGASKLQEEVAGDA